MSSTLDYVINADFKTATTVLISGGSFFSSWTWATPTFSGGSFNYSNGGGSWAYDILLDPAATTASGSSNFWLSWICWLIFWASYSSFSGVFSWFDITISTPMDVLRVSSSSPSRFFWPELVPLLLLQEEIWSRVAESLAYFSNIWLILRISWFFFRVEVIFSIFSS